MVKTAFGNKNVSNSAVAEAHLKNGVVQQQLDLLQHGRAEAPQPEQHVHACLKAHQLCSRCRLRRWSIKRENDVHVSLLSSTAVPLTRADRGPTMDTNAKA